MLNIGTNLRNYLIAAGLLLVGILLGALIFWFVQNRFPPQKEESHTHFHAGFQIYVNGRRLSFSDIKFMHLGKCGADAEGVDMTKVQNRVHLHDNIGNVAHVHDQGVTWGDLLTSISFQPPRTGNTTPKFYLNGGTTRELLSKAITDYDVAVLVYGSKQPSAAQIAKNAITRQHILDAEALLESCGS